MKTIMTFSFRSNSRTYPAKTTRPALPITGKLKPPAYWRICEVATVFMAASTKNEHVHNTSNNNQPSIGQEGKIKLFFLGQCSS